MPVQLLGDSLHESTRPPRAQRRLCSVHHGNVANGLLPPRVSYFSFAYTGGAGVRV